MLVGDTLMGRFITPEPRSRLLAPTRILLAAPYLLFVLTPPIWLAAPVVAIASVGLPAASFSRNA